MQNRQAFDLALHDLKTKLLRMGGDVQFALKEAVESLCVLDASRATKVVENDPNINHQEHAIEDLCIRLIATQQPVATDLRRIVAGMRIASDLERMGDLAVDVAKSTVRLKGQSLQKELIDIPEMARRIDDMISNSLHAYVDNNMELARKLAAQDDDVDHIYRKIVEDLFAQSGSQPEFLQQAVTLAFVGRYLERIGDHATNIGESVIYIVAGERSDLN